MIVQKLTASWQHGAKQDTEEDVKDIVAPNIEAQAPLSDEQRTALIEKKALKRGYGTSYVSPEAAALDKELGKLRSALASQFARRFMKSPIDGLYVCISKNEGREFLATLNPDPRLNARVVCYVLEAGENNSEEMKEWIEKVKNQLVGVPLGRKDKDDLENGLQVVEKLIECPMLAQSSRNEIIGLVAQCRLDKIDRKDFKRRIAEINLEMEMPVTDMPVVAPRRVGPVILPEESVS